MAQAHAADQVLVTGSVVALYGGGYGIVVAVEPGVRIVDLGEARAYELPVESI
jgi:hypothetical protein